MTTRRTKQTGIAVILSSIIASIICFAAPALTKPAKSGSSGIKPGTLKCSLQHTNVVVRQLTALRCEFFTNEAFINVREEQLKAANATVRFIPPGKRTTVSTQAGANRLYRFHFGWAIYPKIPGKITLRLKQVHINFDPFKPDLSVFHLKVQALPTYLQPDIPVGQLQLQLVPVSSRILRKHRIYRFQARITGKGIPADRLPDYNMLFGQQNNYSLYTDGEKKQDKLDINGLTGVRQWQLGLVANRTGSLKPSIPPLNYYDPVKKKVMTLRVDVPGMFAIPSWLYFIGMLLLLLLAAWGIRLLVIAIMRLARYITGLRKLAHRVSWVTNCAEVSVLLKETGRYYGIPSSISLNRFYHHWQNSYGACPELETIVGELNRCCFSATDADSKIKQENILTEARRVTRKLCRFRFAACKRTCFAIRKKISAILSRKQIY